MSKNDSVETLFTFLVQSNMKILEILFVFAPNKDKKETKKNSSLRPLECIALEILIEHNLHKQVTFFALTYHLSQVLFHLLHLLYASNVQRNTLMNLSIKKRK